MKINDHEMQIGRDRVNEAEGGWEVEGDSGRDIVVVDFCPKLCSRCDVGEYMSTKASSE